MKRDQDSMANIAERFNKAFFNQEWEEVIRLKNDLHAAIEAANNKNAMAVYFINLGIAYRHVNDINKSIQCQNSACDIYKKLKNENGQGYCYVNLGNAYADLGLFDEAFGFYDKAIEIGEETNDHTLRTSALSGKVNSENEIKKRTMVITNNQGEKRRFRHNQTVNPLSKSVPYNKDKKIILDLSKRYKVFVSYSRKDRHIVEPIVKELGGKGFSVYFDLDDNPTDDPHSLEVGLSEGLTQCYAMIVCLSKNYVDSEWCRAEIHNFLFQSIREGRIKELPILIIDLDEKTSNGEILLMCFGKLAIDKEIILFQRKYLDASIELLSRLECQIEAILEENDVKPNQVLDSLHRIPFDNSNRTNKAEQIAEILVEIRNKWLEIDRSLSPTFSNIRDFYQIWDEGLEYAAPNKSIQEKERLLDALVSRFPESEVIPLFTKAEALWDFIFKYYKNKTVAREININEVIKEFKPLTRFDVALQDKIERFSEIGLLRILQGIAQKEQSICIFDRPFTESAQYYRDLAKDIDSGRKRLEPRILRGHPVQLIFGEAQCRNLMAPLQYTYYQHLMRNPYNELVAAVVLAGLLITIDMWEERMEKKEQFSELIISPLSTGGDIWSLSSNIENTVQKIYPDKRESGVLMKDWLGSGPKIMMPSQKKSAWSYFKRRFPFFGSKRRESQRGKPLTSDEK